jgi:peptidoglycan/LPS O-acetylase OafA/YrhL
LNETSNSPASEHPRIAAIDGFRGMAILMVTLYRFASVSFTPDVVGKLPAKAISLGSAGVDFFFVLSGFLITGILLESRTKSHYFSTFYVNRSLRIFPLYYGSLVLLLVILPWLGLSDIRDGLKGNPVHLWFYTSNLSVSWFNEWSYPSLDHFWTLAIEEQFYLAWPLVVFWLGPRKLFHTCWVLIVIFATLRIGCSIGGIGDVTEKAFTLFRLDGLLLGAIAAILLREAKPIVTNFKFLRVAFAISVIAFIASLAMGKNDFTIRYTLVSLVAVFLLLQTLASPASSIEKRVFENGGLRSLGKFSYAMYVFQNPLIRLLEPILSPQSLTWQLGNQLVAALAYVFIMFGITYLMAAVSWYGFERWFTLLRHRTSRKMNKLPKNEHVEVAQASFTAQS